MDQKTGYIIFSVAVIVLLGLGWCFTVLLQHKPTKVTEEAEQKLEQELLESLEPFDSSIPEHTVAAKYVSQTRIMPFHPVVSGFTLAPHKIPGVLGLIGVVLVLFSLAWCFLVPKMNESASVGAPELEGQLESPSENALPSNAIAPNENK